MKNLLLTPLFVVLVLCNAAKNRLSQRGEARA